MQNKEITIITVMRSGAHLSFHSAVPNVLYADTLASKHMEQRTRYCGDIKHFVYVGLDGTAEIVNDARKFDASRSLSLSSK